MTDDDLVWQPTADYLHRSRLRRLMHRHGMESYADFYRRSIEDIEWFWETVVRDDLELEWQRPYDGVLDLRDGPARPRWFVDGELNYVVNAVDRHARSETAGRTAVIWEGEEGAVRRLSYAELAQEVGGCASALRALGVGEGDRAGLFMPMVPETAIALLALGRIGAVAVPIFSGFGADAVAARLRDAEARLLVTADGFYRRGRIVAMKDTADAAADAAGVERMLIVRRVGGEVAWRPDRDDYWDEALAKGSGDCRVEATSTDDPCMILYTSGTTGRPKGALHTHAGFPIKAAQDLAHCFDLQADDTLFWLSDIGWMMGPWAIIGALMIGATLMLFEGAPDYPAPDRLWSLCERHRISVLGIAPTVIRSLLPHGDEWALQHDLSSLRILGGAGEPWSPGPWEWYFRVVGGSTRPIINYSGGTETSGGILSCTTLIPIRTCAFNTPVPGMAADVVDESGRSVRGQVGELVVRKPWVGMTHGFWNDEERYLQSYWSRFPGIWTHGDWAIAEPDGSWYIRGRSDDTLKVAGKRLGPAEVESAAVSHPAVLEAAAIGVPDEVKGEAIALFCVLRPSHEPDEALRTAVRAAVADRLGKALAPREIHFVADLPRTRNAKILRRVIRAVYVGEDPGDLSSLENPDSLQSVADALKLPG